VGSREQWVGNSQPKNGEALNKHKIHFPTMILAILNTLAQH